MCNRGVLDVVLGKMMINRLWLLVLASVVLAGCETYSAPRYGLSADNILALKDLEGSSRIKLGAFREPQKFSAGCRAAGPITAADDMGFAAYIRKALADELKVAGRYDERADVVLTGSVDNLAFSSSVGSWDITLTVTSSNGKSMTVKEHYQFHPAFVAETACKRVADAYFPAVQDLIQKLIRSPEFRGLVQG